MKPYIMITNDDGIDSPGLLAAAEAVSGLGEIIIVAPSTQQTGMGRSFPRSHDTGIIDETWIWAGGERHKAYGVHGSPAQAVAYGVMELSTRKPDLCISGINYGENLGLSVSCSGTIGAAYEACSHGIFSIAVSRQAELSKQKSSRFDDLEWTVCKKVVRDYAKMALEQNYSEQESIWNINIPESFHLDHERRWTTQSRQNYSEFLKPKKRDYQKNYELETEICIKQDLHQDSDIYAFYIDRVISVTPLTWNFSVKHTENRNSSEKLRDGGE